MQKYICVTIHQQLPYSKWDSLVVVSRLNVSPICGTEYLTKLFFQVFCLVFVSRRCTATQYVKRDYIVYWGEFLPLSRVFPSLSYSKG